MCRAARLRRDPATDHGLPVPLGGPNMDQTGFRNAPSLMYASFTPPFSSTDGPDGRVLSRRPRLLARRRRHEQPFITPFEMANRTRREVVGRLRNSPATLAAFVAAYGRGCARRPGHRPRGHRARLAAFETEDAAFHPFSSKYDYWLQGQAQLTAAGAGGLDLFNNPAKGNCTACHPSQAQSYDSHALFTDFTFDNIGVPRNWNIPANTPGAGESDRRRRCSPRCSRPWMSPTMRSMRTTIWDSAGRSSPRRPMRTRGRTSRRPPRFAESSRSRRLRNVAVTSPYFHNGVFSDLHQVVEWYVTRDINNDTGQQPESRRCRPRRKSLSDGGHLLYRRGRCARPVRIQRSAGRVRRERQCRRGAVHPADVRRRTGPDLDGAGDRRDRGVSLHAHRRLRPKESGCL